MLKYKGPSGNSTIFRKFKIFQEFDLLSKNFLFFFLLNGSCIVKIPKEYPGHENLMYPLIFGSEISNKSKKKKAHGRLYRSHSQLEIMSINVFDFLTVLKHHGTNSPQPNFVCRTSWTFTMTRLTDGVFCMTRSGWLPVKGQKSQENFSPICFGTVLFFFFFFLRSCRGIGTFCPRYHILHQYLFQYFTILVPGIIFWILSYGSTWWTLYTTHMHLFYTIKRAWEPTSLLKRWPPLGVPTIGWTSSVPTIGWTSSFHNF